MDFERLNGERLDQQIINAKRVNEWLKELVSLMKEEGLKIDEKCRVDMLQHKERLGEDVVLDDISHVEDMEKKFVELNKNEARGPVDENEERLGELFEKYVTVFLHKFLKKDFFVVRSSRYDDINHGVDHLIVDKKTGDIICSFDELASTDKSHIKSKKRDLWRKNAGGVSLKYPLILQNKESTETDICKQKFPALYFSIPGDILNNAIEESSDNINEISDYEKKLFNYFKQSVKTQLAFFNLKKNVEIRGKAGIFVDYLMGIQL